MLSLHLYVGAQAKKSVFGVEACSAVLHQKVSMSHVSLPALSKLSGHKPGQGLMIRRTTQNREHVL